VCVEGGVCVCVCVCVSAIEDKERVVIYICYIYKSLGGFTSQYKVTTRGVDIRASGYCLFVCFFFGENAAPATRKHSIFVRAVPYGCNHARRKSGLLG
jgi:hypothetical protein